MTPSRRPRGRSPRVLTGTPAEHGYTFPAEWRRHAGTWISWPRPEGISFPGFYHRAIEDVAGVVAAIAACEPVHVNVPNANYERIVRDAPRRRRRAAPARLAVHHIPTNECWTRDHGPAFVQRVRRGRAETAVVDWGFNAWGGKYPPWDADDAVPTRGRRRARAAGVPCRTRDGGRRHRRQRRRHAAHDHLVPAQPAIATPGVSQAEIERYLKAYYGQRHVVWLGEGIAGDDTDGHVDDLARFIGERPIVTAVEDDPPDANYQRAARQPPRARPRPRCRRPALRRSSSCRCRGRWCTRASGCRPPT